MTGAERRLSRCDGQVQNGDHALRNLIDDDRKDKERLGVIKDYREVQAVIMIRRNIVSLFKLFRWHLWQPGHSNAGDDTVEYRISVG